MILYYSPLLPWTKKALHSILRPLRYLLWEKRDKMGITWVVWNHLATPKRLGGTGILNLSKHMMAHRFHYYKTCVQTHNHGYLLFNISLRTRVYHMGGQRLRVHGGKYWMDVFHLVLGTRPLVWKCKQHSLIRRTLCVGNAKYTEWERENERHKVTISYSTNDNNYNYNQQHF